MQRNIVFTKIAKSLNFADQTDCSGTILLAFAFICDSISIAAARFQTHSRSLFCVLQKLQIMATVVIQRCRAASLLVDDKEKYIDIGKGIIVLICFTKEAKAEVLPRIGNTPAMCAFSFLRCFFVQHQRFSRQTCLGLRKTCALLRWLCLFMRAHFCAGKSELRYSDRATSFPCWCAVAFCALSHCVSGKRKGKNMQYPCCCLLLTHSFDASCAGIMA